MIIMSRKLELISYYAYSYLLCFMLSSSPHMCQIVFISVDTDDKKLTLGVCFFPLTRTIFFYVVLPWIVYHGFTRTRTHI